MELQEWFYVLGIIFMVVMLTIVVGIFAAVLVIKSKVDHMHQVVSEKIDKVKNVTDKGAMIFRTIRHFMGR